MRALLAAILAIGLVVTAAVPHVHPAGHGAGECAVCVARHGNVAHGETPDVAPRVQLTEAVVVEPGVAPVTGAPLGAIPGQSPPVDA